MAKVLNFSFNISPSSDCWGLNSFRINGFELLAVQEILKSLVQHHNSKAPILYRSAFFMVQLSHSYMITGKNIALIIWTFASNVMSLSFNTLSRLVIAFLPKIKCLLISKLQSLSVVILEIEENKVCHFSLIFLPWSDGTECYDLCILNVEI